MPANHGMLRVLEPAAGAGDEACIRCLECIDLAAVQTSLAPGFGARAQGLAGVAVLFQQAPSRRRRAAGSDQSQQGFGLGGG